MKYLGDYKMAFGTAGKFGYVLYVALHEVYNFYIRASIEVYIKYLESDQDPILS